MKLRIRGDTVRLRLKRSEVERIAAGDSVSEQTHFPGSVLTYRLETGSVGHAEARFDDGDLAIMLPADQVRQWAGTDQVSIAASQTVGSSELSLLVEKDFQCLSPGHHRPGEDDEDTYPHPDAAGGC